MTITESLHNALIQLNIAEEDIPYIQKYGMTRAAIARVTKNHVSIVDSEIATAIRDADFYRHPENYGVNPDNPKHMTYRYGVKTRPEIIVSDLIAQGTHHAGFTSATDASKAAGFTYGQPIETPSKELDCHINWDEIE